MGHFSIESTKFKSIINVTFFFIKTKIEQNVPEDYDVSDVFRREFSLKIV